MSKRCFDVIASVLGLVMLLPVFMVVAFLIFVEDRGTVFYRQERVGKNLKSFYILKFRSMSECLNQQLSLTVSNDPRITRVGRWIRLFKIDELPQLVNVLLGDMSVVGPRPEVPMYVSHYPSRLKEKIFLIRPGITDWCSIQYKNESDLLFKASDPQKVYIEEILPAKLSYYEWYVDHRSGLEDTKIICCTIAAVLLRVEFNISDKVV